MVSPAPAVAEMFTVPVPQRDPLPAVGAEGNEIAVTDTVFAAVQP